LGPDRYTAFCSAKKYELAQLEYTYYAWCAPSPMPVLGQLCMYSTNHSTLLDSRTPFDPEGPSRTSTTQFSVFPALLVATFAVGLTSFASAEQNNLRLLKSIDLDQYSDAATDEERDTFSLVSTFDTNLKKSAAANKVAGGSSEEHRTQAEGGAEDGESGRQCRVEGAHQVAYAREDPDRLVRRRRCCHHYFRRRRGAHHDENYPDTAPTSTVYDSPKAASTTATSRGRCKRFPPHYAASSSPRQAFRSAARCLLNPDASLLTKLTRRTGTVT
jgi:hypothetical protein